MPSCQIKKGFLILRDCGSRARNTCTRCGRPVCGRHRTQEGICVDCYGRAVVHHELDPGAGQAPAWRHAYRHDYYRNSRYEPIYAGRYYDEYYDEYDVRAFDADLLGRDAGEMEDGPEADLFDS